MKCYNIYSKGKKLNKYPISKQEIERICKTGIVSKKIAEGIVENYEISKLKIVE